jgi:hypothetical protein
VRPLELGEQNADETIITRGVALGDEVVTSNQYRLQPGVHVRVSAG